MNATVDRNALADAAKLAASTADPKSPQNILAQTLIRFQRFGIVVAATDLTTCISTDVPESLKGAGANGNGMACFDAKKLSAAVASLPGAAVTLSVDDKFKLTMKAGKATLSLAGRDGRDFPAVPAMPKGADIASDPFLGAIKRTIYALSPDLARFPGAYFHASKGACALVAIDGNRMAVTRFSAAAVGDIDEVTVPPSAIKQIAAALDGMEAGTLAVDGDRLFVQAGDVCVSAKLAAAKPMPWGVLVEQSLAKVRHRVRVNRDEFLSAVRRAGMMTGGGDGKLESGIELLIGDELVVESPLGGFGDASTSLAVEGERHPVTIKMSWRYLADALAAVASETVEVDYAGDRDEVLLRTPGSEEMHLIAPMAPSAKKEVA